MLKSVGKRHLIRYYLCGKLHVDILLSLTGIVLIDVFVPIVFLKLKKSNMEISKIISLLIAAVYVIAFIFAFAVNEERDAKWEENLFKGAFSLIIWLMLSLGCIWLGDELGEGLIGAKYGLVSSPSPGWAVKLMGWVLLVLPALVFIIFCIRGN